MNLIKAVKTNAIGKPLTLCYVIGFSVALSAYAQERGGRDMPKHERPQFSSLDLNGDGSITYAEFEQSEVPNDDYATIFGHIDADGDGVLTEEEFTSHKPPHRER